MEILVTRVGSAGLLKARGIALASVASCATLAFAAPTVVPVVNMSVLGGQYFLDSRSTSFGGNVDWTVIPVVNLNKQTAILPMLTGTYRSTKDVQELVAGGTLTRNLLDASGGARVVHAFREDLKVRGRASYKKEYLQETEDERLSTGLFNYNRFTVGAEGERTLNDVRFRGGYDFYTMRYPHYTSLAADPRATEVGLTSTAGTNILNYNAHEPFVEALWALSSAASVKAGYDLAYKRFQDQKLVMLNGEFQDAQRRDYVHTATLGGSIAPGGSPQSPPPARLGLTYTFQWYASNQNTFDAGRTLFLADYYDYAEHRISPTLGVRVGGSGTLVTLFSELAFRRYIGRLAQDQTGAYLEGKTLKQTTNLVGVSLRYPLMAGVSALVQGSYRVASSNTRYEKVYRYNYNTETYFVGVGYDY